MVPHRDMAEMDKQIQSDALRLSLVIIWKSIRREKNKSGGRKNKEQNAAERLWSHKTLFLRSYISP